MNSLRSTDPRRRSRALTLAALVGLLAPAAVLAAAPATAADGTGTASGLPATKGSVGAALAAANEDGPDAAGYIFGYSSSCRPTLHVTTGDGEVVLESADSGWYASDGSHGPDNTNYIVGNDGAGFRNFFVFDTGALTGDVMSARLDVVQAGGCSSGGGALASYVLNDVTTSVDQLVAGGGASEAGQAVFRDLRVGEGYGSTAVTDVNQDVSVGLTAAALAAIAASDGLFAVGGAYYEKAPVAATTLTADPAAGEGEVGGDVTLTAAVDGDGGEGTPTGTVDFTEGGAAIADCTDVALVPGETIEDPATATCAVPDVPRGLYEFAATYAGDEVYEAGDAGELTYDTRATPQVTVGLVDETEGVIRTEEVALTTEVTGVADETVPTGTVDFLDDGEAVDGCQDVTLSAADGATSATASCQAAFDTTGDHAVTVEYAGDDTYLPAAGGPLAVEVLSDAPTITAAVTSDDEPSAAGWYQSPATVTFTCEGYQGIDECTEPVTVTRNGRTEVRGTATDDLGQQASTSVTVKVDKVAPRIVVRKVRDGATYDRARRVGCAAFDRHSRLAGRCTTETTVVKRFRDGRREVAYTATAADRADNVSVTSGSYFVR